ncbi:MAG: hypothetical protein EAZ90_29830 [Oscillatoriales cyanobacterium]|nr:MAG: hypothetical protein EAZ94_31550 [Oscillatoriales cyanobacterium]TAE31225.1 MAG: hypothetical protein EAZ93_00190 [Oscillatoriales cyanobacterium]TAE35775.1 MAG: hypothetical protein EAZ90_29830 [Oscillatoriales cyanobacterium]
MPSLADALFGRCPLWPIPDALFGRFPLWPIPILHFTSDPPQNGYLVSDTRVRVDTKILDFCSSSQMNLWTQI